MVHLFPPIGRYAALDEAYEAACSITAETRQSHYVLDEMSDEVAFAGWPDVSGNYWRVPEPADQQAPTQPEYPDVPMVAGIPTCDCGNTTNWREIGTTEYGQSFILGHPDADDRGWEERIDYPEADKPEYVVCEACETFYDELTFPRPS